MVLAFAVFGELAMSTAFRASDRTVLVFAVSVFVRNDCPDRAFSAADARFFGLDSFPSHDSFPGGNLSGFTGECGSGVFNDGYMVRDFLGDQSLSMEAWHQEIFGDGCLTPKLTKRNKNVMRIIL